MNVNIYNIKNNTTTYLLVMVFDFMHLSRQKTGKIQLTHMTLYYLSLTTRVFLQRTIHYPAAFQAIFQNTVLDW